MSTGYSEDNTFVDTGYLRDHVSNLRQEKKIALELYEKVKAIKSLFDPTMCDPLIIHRCNVLLGDIERLSGYFGRMADTLEHIDDEVVQLSRALGNLIEEDTERTNYIVSNTIHL